MATLPAYLVHVAVEPEYSGQGGKVEGSKDALRQSNVGTVVGHVVEHRVDVHKPCRVAVEGGGGGDS